MYVIIESDCLRFLITLAVLPSEIMSGDLNRRQASLLLILWPFRAFSRIESIIRSSNGITP